MISGSDDKDSTNPLRKGKGGKYKTEIFIEALREIGSGDKKKVQQKIKEKHGEHAPSERTTHDRLKELEKEGIVKKREIGDTYLWELSERLDKQILQTIQEREIVTTEKLAEIIDEPKQKIEKELQQLKQQEKIKFDLIGSKKAWYIE